MKPKRSVTILFGVLLIFVILTVGTVAAFAPIQEKIYAYQSSDKYTYTFCKGLYMNGSGNCYNYHWNFGDGTNAMVISPIHTYTSSGEKIVTVDFLTPQGQQHLSTSVYPGV
jgi:hypothetical protein